MNKFLFCMFFFFCGAGANTQVTVEKPTEHLRMPLLVGIVGEQPASFVRALKNNLASSGQFEVAVQFVDAMPDAQQLRVYAQKGYPLALVCQLHAKKLQAALYDTQQAHKQWHTIYKKKTKAPTHWADVVTNDVWPQLTGYNGCFTSRIAYCKQVIDEKGGRLQHVYLTDCAGTTTRPLVTARTISVAPRWHPNGRNPVLFYSEFTDKNMRLMALDAQGCTKVIADFDGINMLPTFSQDGKKVAYAASHAGGTCNLFYREARGRSQQLTTKGNNICPVLSDDGTSLFFCSDFEKGYPQIYRHNLVTAQLERLTTGYCTAPSVADNKLAYCKRVDGTMQVFVCDLATGEQRQMTKSYGHKGGSSWSPCGNYLTYAVDRGNSRIAVLHVPSGKSRFITPAHQNCSYPAWSPELGVSDKKKVV